VWVQIPPAIGPSPFELQTPVFGGRPSLSDNHGVRLSLKTINDELERLGSGAVLTKADGYFYFQGGDATDWLDRAVSAPTLRSLTLEQWIGRYRELKAKNEALLAKTTWKDSGTSLTVGNSEAELPRAPNAEVKQPVAGKSVDRREPQKQKEKSKPETYLRLHHVPIFVRDQDQSLRFYLDQLRFRLIVDYNYGRRGRFVLVAPPNGATLLALIAPKPDSAEYEFIGRSGQAVFVTEDVASKFQTWRKRGVRFHHPPKTGTWGGVFTTFEFLRPGLHGREPRWGASSARYAASASRSYGRLQRGFAVPPCKGVCLVLSPNQDTSLAGQDTPETRPVQPPELGPVVANTGYGNHFNGRLSIA
jgi:catechol 2,3-dioxygenase-like lactoylglutathione lyase family enzyme